MTSRVVLVSSGLMMLPCALQGEPSMAYQRTFGPAADPITQLGWGLGIISLSVIVIIGVLLLGGIFRKRSTIPAAELPQSTARDGAGGMAWIYIGTGTTLLILIGCVVWTLLVTAAVAEPSGARAMTVEVTASQWWWSLRYDSPNPEQIFNTANEIHIPVGRPVRFELSSADVIHSFWIPQLAGKMDVIPGQTNVAWLQADQAGVYRGQCAAFCGPQHAHMALLVVAETPEEFAAWRERQVMENVMPATGEAHPGQQIFETHCAPCHTIRGVTPAGIRGPDLTHLMTRKTLAAGLLPNTPENLAGWIANPQSFKPGAHMPGRILTGPELIAVTSYLHTLN